MEQLKSLWSALDARRRIVVIFATVAVFAAVLGMSRMVSNPSMALLYSGLESAAAGEVVKALDQRGLKYEVRGDSIWVENDQRDQVRMALAADGLPANGAAGYELLDGLSGFGTTSQMFDAAYWRAKEGELARTIVTSPLIRAARVHIAVAQQQPFRTEVKPTASVTVTTTRGALPKAQAKALRYLIASAVAGLSPEDVAVIDSVNGLVPVGDEAEPSGLVGDERALELKRNVERLLEARVGIGKAIVEVNIETVSERESIVEKRFDPNGRVVISTDNEDRSGSSSDKGPGTVTVASNLPGGDAANGGSTAQSKNAETRERTNYEVSSTQREVLRVPGALKRLSVAVLVDGITTVDAAGKSNWAPRSAEELTALRDLVASAVGFDKERGDTITLKTLAFEPIPALGTAATASFLSGMHLDAMTTLQLAVLALVALVLGLFVIRPVLTSSRPRDLPALGAPTTGDQIAGSGPILQGEIDEGDYVPGNLSVVSRDDERPAATEPARDLDPVARLRRLIGERQDETVEILRTWMEDREETT